MASDPKLKPFDFASDTSKQLIALATGVTAVTVSFAKDVLGGVTDWPRTVLGIAWGVYLISVISGIVTIMALTGQLTTGAPSIYSKAVTVPAITQCLAFLAATILIVVAGWGALAHH